MNFDVEGPFPLKRYKLRRNRIITNETINDLKENLKKINTGLITARGCYVFAVRASKGIIPYYIGQACRTAIADEALNTANREKYNNEICLKRKGTPLLFLLPIKTKGGRYRTTQLRNLPSIDFLERWLIATALRKNPNLINNKETKYLRTIHVVGLFNARQGGATNSSQALAEAIY